MYTNVFFQFIFQFFFGLSKNIGLFYFL